MYNCILSIDCGENNLGLCILSKDEEPDHYKLLTMDLLQTKPQSDLQSRKVCLHITKKAKVCNRLARYVNQDQSYFCKTHSTDKILIKTSKRSLKTNLDQLALNVYKALDSFCLKHTELLDKIDKVVVERQMKQNYTMCAIEKFIICYFTNKLNAEHNLVRKPVCLVSAKSKYTVYNGPEIPIKYKGKKPQRKHFVCEIGRYIFDFPHKSRIVYTKNQKDYFEKLTKRDDCMDAICQAFAVMRTNSSQFINK